MKSYLKISAIYLVVSLLWIAFSDYALIWIHEQGFIDSEATNNIHSYKGFFFVILSSILIYFLIKRSQEQQERIKNDFQRLFEEHPNPMWIYDIENFKILLANQVACEVYNYKKEAFQQLSLFDLRPKSEHDHLRKVLNGSNLKEPIKDSGVWLHKKKTDELFYVHIYSHATKFQKRDYRIVSAIDVDLMYRYQKARDQLTNRLKEYAFITSHEIRGPITRLMALTDFYDNFKETKVDFVIENIRKTSIELDGIIRRMNEQVDNELSIDIKQSTSDKKTINP